MVDLSLTVSATFRTATAKNGCANQIGIAHPNIKAIKWCKYVLEHLLREVNSLAASRPPGRCLDRHFVRNVTDPHAIPSSPTNSLNRNFLLFPLGCHEQPAHKVTSHLLIYKCDVVCADTIIPCWEYHWVYAVQFPASIIHEHNMQVSIASALFDVLSIKLVIHLSTTSPDGGFKKISSESSCISVVASNCCAVIPNNNSSKHPTMLWWWWAIYISPHSGWCCRKWDFVLLLAVSWLSWVNVLGFSYWLGQNM